MPSRPLRALAAGVHGRRRAAAISPCAPSRPWAGIAIAASRRPRPRCLRGPGSCRVPQCWRWLPVASASPRPVRDRAWRRRSKRCRRTRAVLHGTVRGLEALPGAADHARRRAIEGAPEPLQPAAAGAPARTTTPRSVTSGDLIEAAGLGPARAPPSYPGAWDMQRDAFFADLAGSGYALGPVALRVSAPSDANALDAAVCARRSTGGSKQCCAVLGWPGRGAAYRR